MIEKMKFISIGGLKSDFDRVMNVYLNKFDIHLENALCELDTAQNLKPFVEVNPYKDYLTKSLTLIDKLNPDCVPANKEMTPDQAAQIIDEVASSVEHLEAQSKELKNQIKHSTNLLHQIEPYRSLDFNLKKILSFQFIKFRFGRIAHEHYEKFIHYVYDDLNTLFYECGSDKEYVWGIYFVPSTATGKIDAVYTSFHFERIFIPDEYEGTPEEAFDSIVSEIAELRKQKRALLKEMQEIITNKADVLLLAHKTLENLTRNFDVRKLAACTSDKDSNQVFYILCGWLTKSDSNILLHAIENDPNVYCLTDEGLESTTATPPTKLKNPKIFKPFEMFIHMYGLPAYNEIDPTIFVALTYTLMFGIMFGDVGQGLVLFIGGALLYKLKRISLAAIISIAGIWSAIFGFMYGSIFGYEDILEPIWLSPVHNIMTMLGTSIGFGVCLIIVAMIINIINGIKARDVEKIFFDPSGIAGLICYGSIILCVILLLTGNELPATIVLVILIGTPLLAIFLREPLTRLVKRKSTIFPPGSKVMFFVESLVELFDVVLSYATNTISFVRIGAFALSHAIMMGVVFTLSGATEGNPNIIVIILGNILVAGLEGLVVGIQVLRLEYYEMFSRFYRGTGKAFKPFKSN